MWWPRSATAAAPRPKPDELLVEKADQQDLAQPLNDYDVQSQSSQPNGTTAELFAEVGLAPISEKAFARDQAAFRASPVCVGPYRLETPYAPGDKVISLVRSADYYAENLGFTNGGAGYADRIEFHIFGSSSAVDQAYAAGKVDVAQVVPRPTEPKSAFQGFVEPRFVAKAVVDPAVTDDVVRATPTAVQYLGIAHQQKPEWNEAVVRRAISMAIDRQALAAAVGPSAVLATGFVPPALAVEAGRRGRVDGLALDVTACPSETFPARPDVAGARALLKDAGIDLKGKKVSFEVPVPLDDATMFSTSTLLARQVKKAFGADLLVQPLAMEYYEPLLEEGGMGMSGAFQTGWATTTQRPSPSYNDPASYVRAMFADAGRTDGNLANWIDPQVEQTLDAMSRTDDQVEQNRQFGLAQERLCEQMPYVPTVFTAPLWRVRADSVVSARGDLATGTDGQLLLRELYLTDGEDPPVTSDPTGTFRHPPGRDRR